MLRVFADLPQRLARITRSGKYRPEIDGLRFWAIVPVVAFHAMQRIFRAQHSVSPGDAAIAAWAPEGVVGVVLFFVVSGFIISLQFIRQREAGKAVRLGPYFYRRVTRIEPPYLLLLLATYLLIVTTGFKPENSVSFHRGDFTLTQSLLASLFYLHGSIFNEMPRLFPGGWSLEVEVQFYLLAPVLFFLLFTIRNTGARLGVTLLALVALQLVANGLDQVYGPLGPHRYSIARYAPYFLLGILLAEVEAGKLWPALPTWLWDALAVSGLAALWGTGIAPHLRLGVGAETLGALRLPAIAAMFGGAMQGGTFRAVCRMPWISLLGGACYSIYLTHAQVFQVLAPLAFRLFHPPDLAVALVIGAVVELPLAIAGGLLFYVCVERPFMTEDWPRKLAMAVGERLRLARPSRPALLRSRRG